MSLMREQHGWPLVTARLSQLSAPPEIGDSFARLSLVHGRHGPLAPAPQQTSMLAAGARCTSGGAQAPCRAHRGRDERACRCDPMDSYGSATFRLGGPLSTGHGPRDISEPLARSLTGVLVLQNDLLCTRLTRCCGEPECRVCVDDRRHLPRPFARREDVLRVCARVVREVPLAAHRCAAGARRLPQATHPRADHTAVCCQGARCSRQSVPHPGMDSNSFWCRNLP